MTSSAERMRQHRKTADGWASVTGYGRALRRLAKRYPEEFADLQREEYTKALQEARAKGLK